MTTLSTSELKTILVDLLGEQGGTMKIVHLVMDWSKKTGLPVAHGMKLIFEMHDEGTLSLTWKEAKLTSRMEEVA